jgi:hypothetical protein
MNVVDEALSTRRDGESIADALARIGEAREALFECRTCREAKPASAMSQTGGKVSQPCKACATAKAFVTCETCGHPKPLSAMSKRNNRATQPCKACKAKAERERTTKRPRASSAHDPCPVCGIEQAQHWRCAQCGSRGHQMGRGQTLTDRCGWCEAEELAQRREAA